MLTSVIKIIAVLVCTYLVILVMLFLLQNRMIFLPSATAFGDCLGSDVFEVEPVTAESGVRFYYRAAEEPEAVVLYFHGNAGSACHRIHFIAELEDLPYDFAILEYPGFGQDDRPPTEGAILEAALQLYDEVADRVPNIFLFGESLGSSVAAYVASQREVSGAIFQSPFTSLKNVARAHYPIIPVSLLLRSNFETLKWAEEAQIPIMILSAERDEVVPARDTKRLADSLSVPPELHIFPQAFHNTILAEDEDRYWQLIREFLGRAR